VRDAYARIPEFAAVGKWLRKKAEETIYGILAAIIGSVIVVSAIGLLPLSIICGFENAHYLILGKYGLFDTSLWLNIGGSLFLTAFSFLCLIITSDLKGKRAKEKYFSFIPLALSPGLIFFTTFIFVVALVCLVLYCIYRAFPPVIKFGWYIFKGVHSDMRLLCMVDSALGAASGYYFGSAILGGVVGMILGLVNYEIVSIRWLKLVQKKA
jgi:hypothetical protein